MLRLALLGTPQITLNGYSLNEQLNGRPLAALIYLAVANQPCTRTKLAELLWDELASREDLRKVRTVLPRLRGDLTPYLVITRDTVAFDPGSDSWLDVTIFRNQLTTPHTSMPLAQLAAVLDLYQGDFLGEFTIRNAPEFEAWTCRQREELHQLAVRGYQRLVDAWLKQGNLEAGLNASKRLLALEPWHEEGHRQQMRLFALGGERVAALTQFSLCQRILADEFGLEPSAETISLYEEIRGGKFNKSLEEKSNEITVVRALSKAGENTMTSPLSPRLPASTHLPQVNWSTIPYTPRFYGRQEELTSVTCGLFRDGCQLFGVFGVGGQGKTELIGQLLHTTLSPTAQPLANKRETNLEQTRHQPTTRFTHILWRSLANTTSFSAFVQGILVELGVSLPVPWTRQVEPLLALLAEQLIKLACLLILDKSEMVLPEETTALRNHVHEPWRLFLRWAASQSHESCVLLIGRQQPAEWSRWEEYSPRVRSLHLGGLDQQASVELLSEYGLAMPTALCHELIRRYGGHPFALWNAAETIHEFFAGDLERFFALHTYLFTELHDILDQQLAQLTPAEREILNWLAIERTPLSFEQIWHKGTGSPNQHLYVNAQRSLLRRSLLVQYQNGVGLPPVLTEFLHNAVAEAVAHEVLNASTDSLPSSALLNRYTLNPLHSNVMNSPQQPQADHPSVHTTPQGLLHAVLQQIQTLIYKGGHLIDLQQVLEKVQQQRLSAPGYATANLALLLQHWRESHVPERHIDARATTLPTEKSTIQFVAGGHNRLQNFVQTYQ